MNDCTEKIKAVVSWLITRAKKDGVPITNLSLQKLLYFAWGVHWVHTEKELFEDDFESWAYGPVVPGIYEMFKPYGKNPIVCPEGFNDSPCEDISNTEKESLTQTWERYGDKPPFLLVEETHKEGSPWSITIDKENRVISKNVIKTFFRAAHILDTQYRDVLLKLART